MTLWHSLWDLNLRSGYHCSLKAFPQRFVQDISSQYFSLQVYILTRSQLNGEMTNPRQIYDWHVTYLWLKYWMLWHCSFYVSVRQKSLFNLFSRFLLSRDFSAGLLCFFLSWWLEVNRSLIVFTSLFINVLIVSAKARELGWAWQGSPLLSPTLFVSAGGFSVLKLFTVNWW